MAGFLIKNVHFPGLLLRQFCELIRAVDAARAVFGGDAVAYSPRLYIPLIPQKKLAQAAIRRNGQLYREAGLFFLFCLVCAMQPNLPISEAHARVTVL